MILKRIVIASILLNVAVFFSPILLAVGSWVLSGFNGSPLSEGGPGHGAYIWLYFYVLPIAFLWGVLNVVLIVSSYIKASKSKEV